MRIAMALVLLLALGLCTGAAFADPASPDAKDEWNSDWSMTGYRSIIPEAEPNDPCPTSQSVNFGDIVDPASFGVAGDFDFYKIYLLTTDRLTVIMDRATGCTTTIDTYVDILRDDCTTVVFSDDDDGPGLYSYIMGSEWTPPYDGYYYVKARHYSATGTGCYKIFFFAGLNGNGACCSNTAVCTLVGPGSCTSPSTYQGPGTVCDPNPCAPPPTGACCVPATGACSLTLQANCTSPSIWHGEWTTCSPNPCPQPEPPPVNDTCAGALPLDRCSGGSVAGDLTWAIGDYSPAGTPAGCTGYTAGANGRDVVYLLNVQAGDLVHLVYTTPNHDGSMYIVTDCANAYASCVIGEDDPEPETINWTVATTGTYYLILDAYAANTGGVFTLDWTITCPPPSWACCLPDYTCQMASEVDCAALNGVWMLDRTCDSNPCPQPPTMACCFPDGSCQMLAELACAAAGGVVYAGVACEPQNPCPPPPPEGACCFADGSCQLLLQGACAQLGGVWMPGLTCTPNPCPPPPATGACCFVDGSCQVLTQAACVDAQGQYQGNDIPCTPALCPPPVPTERTTWGRVKNTYR